MEKEAKTKSTKKKTVLKWKNRYSGEQGYVQSVSVKKGYFTNTFNKDEAKTYTSDSLVSKDLDILRGFGEMENNDFYSEEA